MKVLVIGAAGAIGGLLVQQLRCRGDVVTGLVRRHDQEESLASAGVRPVLGDLSLMTAEQLSSCFRGHDVVVFAAGSNASTRAVTDAVDDLGLRKVVDAAVEVAAARLIVVSVLPESWRARRLTQDVEHYFAVKKRGDVLVSRSDLDWTILRPSLLTDDPATGKVALGPAEWHDSIPRADVAAVLAALVHEPRLTRQIVEVNTGTTPITQAVRAVVHNTHRPVRATADTQDHSRPHRI